MGILRKVRASFFYLSKYVRINLTESEFKTKSHRCQNRLKGIRNIYTKGENTEWNNNGMIFYPKV